MAKSICSRKRAGKIYAAIWLVGLAFLFIMQSWWPYLLLVIGTALGVKQWLVGKRRDATLTFVVFYGFFAITYLDVSWQILVPSVMLITAFYIVAKEWLDDRRPPTEKEIEEETRKELEEKDL